MASKELTSNRYIGKVCAKHPEFGGLRVKSGGCVECQSAKGRAYRAEKYSMDLTWRQSEQQRVAHYRQDHPAVRRSSNAKFKCDIDNRTPTWADPAKIRQVYQDATTQNMVVDHIIPLRGKLVSGLHVHNNLQLLPASKNAIKGNKYVP